MANDSQRSTKDDAAVLNEGLIDKILPYLTNGSLRESEEDFTEFCEFLKIARFDKFGAFPYSREENTPAYDFEDQIDEQTKQDRYDALMAVQMEISAEKAEEKVGKTLEVLVEGYDPVAQAWFGRSAADAPDVDGKVFFAGKKGQYTPGNFINVHITEGLDYDLVGEVEK